MTRQLKVSTEGVRLSNTELMGVRHHEDTIEIIETTSRLVQRQSVYIDLLDIEKSIIESGHVADVCVLHKANRQQEQKIIAYCVADAASEKQIAEFLHKNLPKYSHPDDYVWMERIPVTASGQVDTAGLLDLPVISSRQIAELENRHNSHHAAPVVAYIKDSRSSSTGVLHLKDIVEDYALYQPCDASNRLDNKSATPAITDDETNTANAPLAIIHGEMHYRSSFKHLAEVLENAAAKHPENGIMHINCRGEVHKQSYPDLLTNARKICAGLYAQGISPAQQVIFQINDNKKFIEAFWACQLGGFVPVPLTIAPAYNHASNDLEKLQKTSEMLGDAIVLADGGTHEAITNSKLLTIAAMRIVNLDTLASNNTNIKTRCGDNPLALLLLTSGSTGTPKIVQQSHAALIQRASSVQQLHTFNAEEVSLNWMPLEHVGGIVMFHLRDVLAGMNQIHVKTEYILQNPLRWLDCLSEYKVNITWAPNFAYALVNESLGNNKGTWDLRSLRFILNGGESIVAATARRFIKLLHEYGLELNAMYPAWGMSETCSGVTFNSRFSLQSSNDDDVFVSVGEPIPGFSVRITDEANNILGVGSKGKLQVKGYCVTAGYLNNDKANAESFTADGWFDTGDLAYLHDGGLVVAGRDKDVIISNGINYYSHEIEAQIDKVENITVSYTAACAIRNRHNNTDDLAIFFHTEVNDDNDIKKILQEIVKKSAELCGLKAKYLIRLEKADVPKTSIGKIQRQLLIKQLYAGKYDAQIMRSDVLLANSNTLPKWFFKKDWNNKLLRPVYRYIHADITLVYVPLEKSAQVLAKKLIPVLSKLNARLIVVESANVYAKVSDNHYQLNCSKPDDYRQMLTELAASGVAVNNIVHYGCYNENIVTAATDIEQADNDGIYSILNLIKALNVTRHTGQIRLHVVTSGVHGINNAVPNYQHAGVIGFLKTVGHEIEWLETKHIDIDKCADNTHIKLLLNEIRALGSDDEVAYKNEQRYVSVLKTVDPLTPDQKITPHSIKRNGVYVVTGGLGGIGRYLSKRLITDYAANLIIIGRTQLSDSEGAISKVNSDADVNEKLACLKALSAYGTRVEYIAAELSDAAALKSKVRNIVGAWGAVIDGIFHLAGEGNLQNHWKVVDEHWISNESAATFEWMFKPKRSGTANLYALIEANHEALFVAFSSINGVMGGATFSAYSAANSYLDQYIRYKRLTHPRSYSFNWTMWDDVGMSKNNPQFARDASRAMGYRVINLDEGYQSMRIMLHSGVMASIIGLDADNQHIGKKISDKHVIATSLCGYVADRKLMEQCHAEVIKDEYATTIPCRYRHIDVLPLTATGDLHRGALQQLHCENEESSGKIAPRTDMEKAVAAIWSCILSVDSPGIYDNYFELGGNSLQATQIIARINETFAASLSVRALFEAATIADIAQLIRPAHGADTTYSITPLSIQDKYELSFSQQRLWFVEKYEGANAIYNMPGLFRITGKLDYLALNAAFKAIIERHEVLRTIIKEESGIACQFVQCIDALNIDVENITDADDVQSVIDTLAHKEAQTPFDLTTEWPIRIRLLVAGHDEHIMLITLHHIACDAWSVGILMKELTHYYQEFKKSKSTNQTVLAIQYKDFAAWQRNHLKGERLDAQLAYWQSVFASEVEPLDIHTSFQRPTDISYAGKRAHFNINKTTTDAIKALCRKNNCTMYTGLLTAYYILLHRYTGKKDICVGTPVANRMCTEIEPLIGFFVNTLALRFEHINGESSFIELLDKVKQIAAAAFEHQELPFEKLLSEINVERARSHTPLFQVMFIVQDQGLPAVTAADITLTPLTPKLEYAKYEITFDLHETDNGLDLEIEYNTDLFSDIFIARLAHHYENLLNDIAMDARRKMACLRMVDDAECENLKQYWDDNSLIYDKTKCIHSHFEDRVSEQNECENSIAVKCQQRSLTYQQLNAQANQLARQLIALGAGPEKFVAVCMLRTERLIVSLMAVLKAGAAYVPIDPDLPKERIDYVINDANAAILITQRCLIDRINGACATIITEEDFEYEAEWPQTNPVTEVCAHHLAYIIYTSGSTGMPKGVAIQHSNANALIAWMAVQYSRKELSNVLASTTISFDLSIFEIFGTLALGGTIHLADNALELANMPSKNEVTLINTVPSAIAELLRCDAIPQSVCTVNLAGELLKTGIVDDLYQRLHIHKVYDLYGPSEDTTYSTFKLRKPGAAPSIGRPIKNTWLYITDQYRNLMPEGLPGEILLCGDGVTREYLNKKAATAEKYITNHISTHGRLYCTGDLARINDEGDIEYLGRIDQQVKIRGYRIEIGEVEAALNAIESIKDSVVVEYADDKGNKHLLAYIVDRSGTTDIAALRNALAPRLPAYMIPTLFVYLDALPRLPNGKLNKKALPNPALTAEPVHGHDAPQTASEIAVAAAFGNVLQKKNIGINNSFFDMGGHSLLSMQLISSIKAEFNIEISLKEFFESPTVKSLSAIIDARVAVSNLKTNAADEAAEGDYCEGVL